MEGRISNVLKVPWILQLHSYVDTTKFHSQILVNPIWIPVVHRFWSSCSRPSLTLAVVQPPLIFLSLISLLLISMHTSNLRGNCLCECAFYSPQDHYSWYCWCCSCCLCVPLFASLAVYYCVWRRTLRSIQVQNVPRHCVYIVVHTAPTSNWCNVVHIRWYITKSVPIIVITRNIITTWIIQFSTHSSYFSKPTCRLQIFESYHLSSSTYSTVVRKLARHVVTDRLHSHKFPHAQLINCKISWSCNTKVDELHNWVNHILLTICLVYFVKGGPLSLLMTVGMPCVASIRSNLGIIALAEVEWTMSTSGNLE